MNRANVIVGAAIGIVLLVALAVVFGMRTSAPGNIGEPCAVIHDADGKTYEMPLSVNAEKSIQTSLGTNVVVVENGAVFVREADCANHDCMHQGKLDAPGAQIICLPHELWIEVVANGQFTGHMDMNAVADGSGSEGFDAVAR